MGQIIKMVVAGIVLSLVVLFVDARWGVRTIGARLNYKVEKLVSGTPAVYDSMVSVSTGQVNGAEVEALLEQDVRTEPLDAAAPVSQENSDDGVSADEVHLKEVFDIYEKASKQATVPDGAEEAPAVVKE